MQLAAPFTLCAVAGLSPAPALCRPASMATSAGRSLCNFHLLVTVYQTEKERSSRRIRWRGAMGAPLLFSPLPGDYITGQYRDIRIEYPVDCLCLGARYNTDIGLMLVSGPFDLDFHSRPGCIASFDGMI